VLWRPWDRSRISETAAGSGPDQGWIKGCEGSEFAAAAAGDENVSSRGDRIPPRWTSAAAQVRHARD
jgi:hypothetical protein